MLFCNVCNMRILIERDSEFNYTSDGDGPFCDNCWFFVEHIEALRDRVTDLEKVAQQDAGERQRQENIQQATRHHSPYDCSRRRG
jgi:hypothetical protein